MTTLDSLWAEEAASVLHELPSLWYLVTVILSELMDTFRAPMCKIGKIYRKRQRQTWGETGRDRDGKTETEKGKTTEKGKRETETEMGKDRDRKGEGQTEKGKRQTETEMGRETEKGESRQR